MTLINLKSVFEANGCQKIYVKKLSPNDNSKNQVYLAGSFEILNILPISTITTEVAGEWERERFKATLNFSWIADDGNIYRAPDSKLILYPKYPEVRFSGFLIRCQNPPSELMTKRLEGRLLFISVANDGKILGYVAAPDSNIASEFDQLNLSTELGVFKIIELIKTTDTRDQLLAQLRRINQLGWISSKRLDRNGNVLPCSSPNCGGYTLEAELGITPNGYSEPDYLGWEVKQFGVDNFNRIGGATITLMTPEPTGGIYIERGLDVFVGAYGYADLNGRADRMNFGGIHKAGERHARTKLKLELIGFDKDAGKIKSTNGMIALVDQDDNVAASWDFASMLLHWNRKHNRACFVPSLSEKEPERKYWYGDIVILGSGTDFELFIQQISAGNVYYDPGIKIENISTAPRAKKRSQFRIKSQFLNSLYHNNEIINL